MLSLLTRSMRLSVCASAQLNNSACCSRSLHVAFVQKQVRFDSEGEIIDYEVRQITAPTNRLDTVLRLVSRQTNRQVEEAILTGKVRVNGEHAKKAQGVNEGDVIDVILRPSPENDQLNYVHQYELDELEETPSKLNITLKVRKDFLVADYGPEQ